MRPYERVLRFTLEHKLVLAAVLAAADRGNVRVLSATPARDLLPAMDEGGFIVDYIMPAGSSLEETNRVITHLEKILARHSGSGKHFAPHRSATRPGAGDGSQYRRYFGEAESTTGSAAASEVIAEVRASMKKAEPVVDLEFPQLLQDMIGDLTSAPEPVVIKLFAQDPDLLKQWAISVGDNIKKIPGVVDAGRHRKHHQRPGRACSMWTRW